MRAWLLMLLLLLAPAWAEGTTVLQAVQALRGQVQSLTPSGAELTWGQQQARDDLRQLEESLGGLESALGTPQPDGVSGLQPWIDRLAASQVRLRTSLPLLGPGTESVLSGLAQLSDRLRQVGLRFTGKAPPRHLGQVALVGTAELPYANPAELAVEARNVEGLAESLSRPNGGRRTAGGLGTGDWYAKDMHEFVLAANDFEAACSASYRDVHQTERSYRRLRSAYERASMSWSSQDFQRVTQLQKAMGRLEQFYAALDN